MFLAHYGAAFGAKFASPKTSLGTLFIAAAFIDLLWPMFLLIGLEQVRIAPGVTAVTPMEFTHYPYSHSLVAASVWSAFLYGAYRWVTGYARGAAVIGALVTSHWILDAIAHRPDLPLYPGSRWYAGLGLWYSPAGTLVFELLAFGTGIILYRRATLPRNRTGQLALTSLVTIMLLIYFGSFMGPPPPSVAAIVWSAQAQWLLVIWAYWIDRNRSLNN